MTTLKVSDLQHTYPNGVVAVSNVNVEIQQGEQISVVGQNGSCLLYTSPSPRDRTRSRMPSSA